MGFFGKIFKKETTVKTPRGFHNVSVKTINRLTKDAVEIVFDIPADLKETFSFFPGQYLTLIVEINQKEERRSYSICSENGADLAIAVKEVENGIVSKYLNNLLKSGDSILISKPEGRFLLNDAKKIIAIAAGSGITPIVSMAYEVQKMDDASMKLFYVNKKEQDILFQSRLNQLSKVETTYFLTQEEKEGYAKGRVGKDAFMSIIKEDLSILKSDGFYICGPEEMIHHVKEALQLFGVSDSKIHFELFTTALSVEKEVVEEVSFSGTTKVKVVLDDETFDFEMKGNKSVLESAISEGADVPYSCKGGVCSTCRAKVLKGTVKMKVNYTLTDKEIEQGYILSCQTHPTSSELIISYDE